MSTFYLDYNVTGTERKRLVKAIAAYTQADAKYLGVPSCAYQVDYFHIDKAGCVSFDDRADSEEIEGLIETLVSQGFVAQVSDLGAEDEEPEINWTKIPTSTEGLQAGDYYFDLSGQVAVITGASTGPRRGRCGQAAGRDGPRGISAVRVFPSFSGIPSPWSGCFGTRSPWRSPVRPSKALGG